MFEVSAGELHLTILLENMRREGFELAVGRPRVVFKRDRRRQVRAHEMLTVDVEEDHQGASWKSLASPRRIAGHAVRWQGRTRLEYRIPARGLIGFQGEFLHADSRHRPRKPRLRRLRPDGRADGRAPQRRADLAGRRRAVAYALWKLQDRGRMFVSPGDALYEGMVIGIHTADNDLVVNPIKGKRLTNVRASGTDEAVRLVPPIQITLESAINSSPTTNWSRSPLKSIRLRKRYLKEHERKRASRAE